MNRDFVEHCRTRVNTTLNQCVSQHATTSPFLHEAMTYVILGSGKRLRPLLVYSAGKMFGSPWENLDIAAAAMELTHLYSLVHDDLPAMDNSDYRRGRLSCHKAFDEATAILVGDALLTMAFECLVTMSSPTLSPEQTTAMVKVLAQASGPSGMIAGQDLDLRVATGNLTNLTATDMDQIHSLKTGALFKASVELGLIGAGIFPNEATARNLGELALLLGNFFQLKDDLSDNQVSAKTDTPQTMEANSYLHFGIEKTEQRLTNLHSLIQQHLESYPSPQHSYLETLISEISQG